MKLIVYLNPNIENEKLKYWFIYIISEHWEKNKH